MADYGSWLIEDLRDHVKELLVMKSRVELYSERAEYNIEIHEIETEIMKRGNNIKEKTY